MNPKFCLQIFYEQSDDRQLSEDVANNLRELVNKLAPHIELQTSVLPATSIEMWRIDRDSSDACGPTHPPTSVDTQTLVVTNREFGSAGHGWAQGRACVSRREMETKARKCGDPTEIVIHEWLHTIVGRIINGRRITNPDQLIDGFTGPSGIRPDGAPQWFDWYRHLLRWE
jgi:hypothetical protein